MLPSHCFPFRFCEFLCFCEVAGAPLDLKVLCQLHHSLWGRGGYAGKHFSWTLAQSPSTSVENKGVYHTTLSQSSTQLMLGSPEWPFSRKIPLKTFFFLPLPIFLREEFWGQPLRKSLCFPPENCCSNTLAKACRMDHWASPGMTSTLPGWG